MEVLFQPSPTGREASGFHDTSFQSFKECDICTRKELYTNAVFHDGTAMFQRIVERMTKGTDGHFSRGQFIIEDRTRLLFQRIVERMTKELTDTMYDDSSSKRRRGESCREKKENNSWSGRTRSVRIRGCSSSSRSSTSLSWRRGRFPWSRPSRRRWSMSLLARDYMREEPNLHLEFHQRDVTDDAVTLRTSC